jgi:EAL domain-containing protein (putative c-di-GMP-specific phosphodiesterase class I)/FixJ family two-component response regulator
MESRLCLHVNRGAAPGVNALEAARTILVLDDDAAVAELILTLAATAGFAGATVSDCRSLLKHFARREPSVITVDLRLPNGDGIEVLRQLGQRHARSQIILISGVDQRTLASAQRVAGALGLRLLGALQKPFRNAELRKLLETARGGMWTFSEAEIEQAITRGEFFLEFQPKIAVSREARRLIGAEALVRWRHPSKGVVPPLEFISLVEASSLLKPFTLTVFRNALHHQRTWIAAGHDLSVAVNIGAGLLDDDELPEELGRIAQGQQCDPNRIVLELTETGIMRDADKSLEILTRLRLKDFELSMDDFGTGYSSLLHLHRMPFSEIKIDRSFVSEMSFSREAAAIVSLTVDLGHNLGVKVCAEGVEDEATHERIVATGCDVAQGYYYGKPTASPVFPRALAEDQIQSSAAEVGTPRARDADRER